MNEKALHPYIYIHFESWQSSKVCCCFIPQTLLSLLPSSWKERWQLLEYLGAAVAYTVHLL